jgi:hypothetical protein
MRQKLGKGEPPLEQRRLIRLRARDDLHEGGEQKREHKGERFHGGVGES